MTATSPLSLAAQEADAAARYIEASTDTSGSLRIAANNGRIILQKKEAEQVGFDQIAISDDGRAVGWLALYENCCTSYPIPLKLVVYSGGKLRSFTGADLPVWEWCFAAGSKRVAYKQETVHGGFGTHYELRDVGSGRLVAEYDPPVDRDNQPLPDPHPPTWVTELTRRH